MPKTFMTYTTTTDGDPEGVLNPEVSGCGGGAQMCTDPHFLLLYMAYNP